jgi:hypothetical protein
VIFAGTLHFPSGVKVSVKPPYLSLSFVDGNNYVTLQYNAAAKENTLVVVTITE